ncbi:MAG: hypothetical protein ACHP79_06300, partial [Terriglobales bacterium]
MNADKELANSNWQLAKTALFTPTRFGFRFPTCLIREHPRPSAVSFPAHSLYRFVKPELVTERVQQAH